MSRRGVPTVSVYRPLPEMIERAVSVANRQRVLNGAADIGLRFDDRVVERTAERQIGGDRGGEGAAGSMSVLGGDADALNFNEPFPVEQHVDDFVTVAVASFDDDSRTAQAVNLNRRCALLFD